MRISTALNHCHRFEERAHTIYQAARQSGLSHEWILEQMAQRVWQTDEMKRCPSWVHTRVSAKTDVYSDQLHLAVLYGVQVFDPKHVPAFLRWQLKVDGKHTTSDEVSAMREAGDERVWYRVEGAHIWNHKPEKTFSGWKNVMSS